MKRKTFLKTLGVALLTPKIDFLPTTVSSYDSEKRFLLNIDEIGHFKVEDVLKLYRQTGILLYK